MGLYVNQTLLSAIRLSKDMMGWCVCLEFRIQQQQSVTMPSHPLLSHAATQLCASLGFSQTLEGAIK